jgi:hypothetical protein
VKRKGVAKRRVRKKRGTNVRVDEQKPDVRRLGWTSKLCIAKSKSIKSRGRRLGDCAWKAAGITPGDLGLLSWQHDWGSREATRAQGRSQQRA